MPSTCLPGCTYIAELLTADDCLVAVEAAFRAHRAGQALPPAILGVPAAGLRSGRTSGEEIMLFDSTGTALQDVAAAVEAHEKAVRLERGETIDLGR